MDPVRFSYAHLGNLPLLEELYLSFSKDPESVDPSWRSFFEGMEFGRVRGEEGSRGGELRIYRLINAYRCYGHLSAQVNPLDRGSGKEVEELSLEILGFTPEEGDQLFPTCGFLDVAEAPLHRIVEALKGTYCGSVGIEYMGLGEGALELWIQRRIEPGFPLRLSQEEKLEILHHLSKAELFESFLHTKYVGQKRFSLEGGEALIPVLQGMIEQGAAQGVAEVVLGMSHRGRLNVLANILNKSYAAIFHEFEDFYAPDFLEGSGDVKYHKGFAGTLDAAGRRVGVVLSANPSHLESVDPVVEGHVRAKQELRGSEQRHKEVVPFLIHGDAALAGQGVVYETLQMCRLNGYATGGTVHIVVNNQIGFTTLPKDSRSTRYCTDIARSFGAPVFHVNGEDPEACVVVARLAMDLRQHFGCDVFIDLLCHRKYGHNEGDEPLFTQPLEYQKIKEKLSIRQMYQGRLIGEGVLTQQEAEQLEVAFKKDLQEAQARVHPSEEVSSQGEVGKGGPLFEAVRTGVAKETLLRLAEEFCSVPAGFALHPKVQRLLKERLEMVQGDVFERRVDWGMAEHLAFASLLHEKRHIRISGQDSRRGTFTHRHAVWVDQKTGARYFPLSHLKGKQGYFDVYNSHLSELAVLGFEFGYTLSYPEALVIWEAQFGDFANGAQIMIDQYLASSEQKWQLSSNLTLMLPHGYEGQGPEHSSARVERYLQLCAQDNIQVVNCTTPAQLFHLLRRQAIRGVRKPLVLFTPKGLLRHPEVVSCIADFTEGCFQEVLEDPQPPQRPTKVVLCSGRIFYDLCKEREQRKEVAVAIIRVEQLYPLNEKRLKEVVGKYPDATKVVWAQEEQSNMGGWEYIRPHLEQLFGKVEYAGRERAASPAAGSHALHKKQYARLMEQVFKE